MASTSSIPAFLLPRGIPRSTMRLLPGRAVRPRTSSSPSANAPRCTRPKSTSSTSKPRVIPQPDKFRPPSHPARRVMQNNNREPRNYGAPLSAEEKLAQKTKRYPNMFPPEGTVMHRFLTNKGIHVWISMSVLFSLAAFTWSTNFKQTSPFAHLLPSWGQFFTSPFSSTSQFFTIMKMHSDHRTLEAAEKRKRLSDDVVKRREYRIAHGLEEPEEGAKEGVQDDQSPIAVEGAGVGEQRVERRPVKKWLGIW